jgi:hypothetical protein
VLTINSKRGRIITTGRFSREAETYAASLQDVTIELIDAAKLAHMISVAFPNGALPTHLSTAIKTTPDADFPSAFEASIFSKDRFQCGVEARAEVRIARTTHYEPFFVATYHAYGNVNTAVGEFTETWYGALWISGNGRRAGFGTPRFHGRKLSPLVPLGEALSAVPGSSEPPQLQPHQAVAGMKDFVASRCVKSVWYRGRNNRNYSATISPTASTIIIEGLAVCYIPVQEFALEVDGVRYEGEVDEAISPPAFQVTCPSLSTCCICGTATTSDNQILCSICHQPAHRWSIFFPDSFQCEACGGLACRNHMVRTGRRVTCTRCSKGGTPLRARWTGHFLFGLVTFVLIAMSVLLALLVIGYNGTESAHAFMATVLAVGTVLGVAAWMPCLVIIAIPSVRRTHNALIYAKPDFPKLDNKKPEWLYGQQH